MKRELLTSHRGQYNASRTVNVLHETTAYSPALVLTAVFKSELLNLKCDWRCWSISAASVDWN